MTDLTISEFNGHWEHWVPCCCSVAVVSDCLQSLGLLHARFPCPSPSARWLDCEESWAPKNWCFWTVVLEKTPESPLLKLMYIKSVMSSNHLVLCHPLLLPSIFPSTSVFPKRVEESALHIRWSKYWRFSLGISLSNEYSGLISFRTDWFDLLAI